MNFIQPIASRLAEVSEPLVTAYRLGVIIHDVYQAKENEGRGAVESKVRKATHAQFGMHLQELIDAGLLKRHRNFPNTAFRIIGRPDENPGEIACTVDPFCTVSHLSAMAWHGLTDRIPHRLFLSSLPSREWNAEAAKLMRQDLGDDLDQYVKSGLPAPAKPVISKIDRTEIHVLNTRNRGAFLKISGRTLRVSKIGRVFLEMLRNPELCGGLRHVIETYQRHAAGYLRLIVSEIDRHGEPIDKIRAGYILEEKAGIRDETVESWTRFAQRGGSRKLDATAPYHHEWSDKWLLSLNLA